MAKMHVFHASLAPCKFIIKRHQPGNLEWLPVVQQEIYQEVKAFPNQSCEHDD